MAKIPVVTFWPADTLARIMDHQSEMEIPTRSEAIRSLVEVALMQYGRTESSVEDKPETLRFRGDLWISRDDEREYARNFNEWRMTPEGRGRLRNTRRLRIEDVSQWLNDLDAVNVPSILARNGLRCNDVNFDLITRELKRLGWIPDAKWINWTQPESRETPDGPSVHG